LGFEPLPIFDGGVTGVERGRRNIVGDAAFCRDHGAIANGEMAGRADLAGKNAAIADSGGARESNLAAEHGVCSYLRSVADQNQIIEFGSAADACFADGCAVHAGIGLDFYIVLENGRAGLRHLVPGTVFLFGEAKSVPADDGAVLENDAVAYATVFANDDVRVREEVVTDLGAAIERHKAVQNSVISQNDAFVQETVWADVRPSADSGGFGDDRSRMNPGRVFWRLIEKLDGTGKGEIGIRSAKSCQWRGVGGACHSNPILDENCGGPGGI